MIAPAQSGDTYGIRGTFVADERPVLNRVRNLVVDEETSYEEALSCFVGAATSSRSKGGMLPLYITVLQQKYWSRYRLVMATVRL